MLETIKKAISKDPRQEALKKVNSSVITTLEGFNEGKANAQSELNKNVEKLSSLKTDLLQAEEKCIATNFAEKHVKTVTKIKQELAEIETIIEMKNRLIGQKNIERHLSDEEKAQLLSDFNPIRAKQDKLFEKIMAQLVEVETTLVELEDERQNVQEIYSHVFGVILQASGYRGDGVWADCTLARLHTADIKHKLIGISNEVYEQGCFYY